MRCSSFKWDRRDPTRNPLYPNRHVSVLGILHRCQDQVARFTMRPTDYIVYDKIVREFLGQLISYEEFRFRMGRLLQECRYDHLRFFFEVLQTRLLGIEQEKFQLILYPAVIFVLFYSYLSSAQMGETTLCDHRRNRDIQLARILDPQWKREWSRLGKRRYYPRYFAPGENPVGALDRTVNPEVFFKCFLNWCQDQAVRVIMLPQEYRSYERMTFELRCGHLSREDFKRDMRVLLQHPKYGPLRLWWEAYYSEVDRGVAMEHHPSFTWPLRLCVTMSISQYSSLFGKSHLSGAL